jgi:glucose-1-phosphate cytidylyltransferase
MKVLILAGGLGTRLSEETDVRPKPMVEIGGKPILWHIMKAYSKYGFNEFVILLGYKGYVVKEYFANYFLHMSDVTLDLTTNSMEVMNNFSEPWKVTLLDTGVNTQTAGRIRKARNIIGGEPFLLTYGDGISDVNINNLIKRHDSHGGVVTMTVVQPAGRFGSIKEDSHGSVKRFLEKPQGDGSWVNGGFFVCNPTIFDYLGNDDAMPLEKDPLESLAKAGQLFTHKHSGFWKCMDTIKDKHDLDEIIKSGHTPWL